MGSEVTHETRQFQRLGVLGLIDKDLMRPDAERNFPTLFFTEAGMAARHDVGCSPGEPGKIRTCPV